MKLLNVAEAAEILGVSKRTLYQWGAEGKGPSRIKVGNWAVRYRLEDINEYIREHTCHANTYSGKKTESPTSKETGEQLSTRSSGSGPMVKRRGRSELLNSRTLKGLCEELKKLEKRSEQRRKEKQNISQSS